MIYNKSNANLKRIENIPKEARILNLFRNQISKIENIPEGVKEVYLGWNPFTKLENIPEGVEMLNVWRNQIVKIDKQSLENIRKSHTKVYGVDVEMLEVEG